MVNDHAKILKLLKKVSSHTKQDTKSLLRSFHTFEWNLEKHIFVEERAVFTSYNPEHVFEGYDVFLELSKEHTVILEKLKEIKEDLLQGKGVELLELRKLLIKHKNFEEQSIYPTLDQEINESEKHYIIERIKEIV